MGKNPRGLRTLPLSAWLDSVMYLTPQGVIASIFNNLHGGEWRALDYAALVPLPVNPPNRRNRGFGALQGFFRSLEIDRRLR
jgi:hypothetical protein